MLSFLILELIDMAQPIYVCREDHNSRATTIKDILQRVKSLTEWREIGRILVFPEGTCTNRTSLIQVVRKHVLLRELLLKRRKI